MSQHRPFDSFSGSIGITRRGKHTEEPRSRAPGRALRRGPHIVTDIAIATLSRQPLPSLRA